MKIEVKEKKCAEYYDELLFIQSNYKKILNNKIKKVSRMTMSFVKYAVLSIIFFCLTLLLYLKTKDNFYFIICGVYILLVICSLYLVLITKKRVKELMTNDEDTIININTKNIEHKSTNSIFKISWEDMAFVLINKYSICFIPKTTKNSLVCVPISYKEDIIKLLKKYKKDKLIREK